MSLFQLLRAMVTAGITVSLAGEKLLAEGNLRVIATLRPQLQLHKPALRQLLADGRYDAAMRDAEAYEVWLREPWGDKRWISVDRLLALHARPRHAVRVNQLTAWRRKPEPPEGEP